MRLFLFTLALAAGTTAHAQQPSPTWSVTLDIPGRGEVKELAIAANGDIVVGGAVDRAEESVQASALDGWLARYDSDGRLIWEHRIGGEFRDEVDGLAIAPDGSIYIAGPRDVQLRQSVQNKASYVSRYTADGRLVWSTPIDDPDGSEIWLTSLRLLDDGSVIVAGSKSFKSSSSDAYIARFNADGKRLWQQWPPNYPAGVDPVAPGKNFVVRSATGEIRVQEHGRLGRMTQNTIELIATQPGMAEPLPARCIVVDLKSGERADDACGPMNDYAMHMTAASFPFTASGSGNFAAGEGLVRKYDAAASIVWQFATQSDDGDGFNAAAATPDGGVVVAGYRLEGATVGRHNWDGLLVKLDRDGKLIWRRNFDEGKRDELNNVAALPDGSIIVAGYTTPAGSDIWVPWIMHLNSDGRLD